MATATVNSHPVSFDQANDPDPAQPTVATVNVTVTLAFDDLVAALYAWNFLDPKDMHDPDYARGLIAEAVTNMGLVELSQVKADMAQARPGSADADWLAYCQQRARELLAASNRTPVPADRRELVGAVR